MQGVPSTCYGQHWNTSDFLAFNAQQNWSLAVDINDRLFQEKLLVGKMQQNAYKYLHFSLLPGKGPVKTNKAMAVQPVV